MYVQIFPIISYCLESKYSSNMFQELLGSYFTLTPETMKKAALTLLKCGATTLAEYRAIEKGLYMPVPCASVLSPFGA